MTELKKHLELPEVIERMSATDIAIILREMAASSWTDGDDARAQLFTRAANALGAIDVGAAPCDECGGPAPEYTVPNEAWNTIIRNDGREGPREYICLNCFAATAARRIRSGSADFSRLVHDALTKMKELHDFKVKYDELLEIGHKLRAAIPQGVTTETRNWDRATKKEPRIAADVEARLKAMREKRDE